MKLSTWMIITAILGLVFGLGYLLMPSTLLDIYGIDSNPSTLLAARFFGGSVVGWGVLAWFARGTAESAARSAITLSLFVTFFIGLVLTLMGVVSGVFNVYGWLTAALFLIFALAHGYYRFIKA